MKKMFFEKKFVLGLYTYIRQIELSIDRSLPNSWEELIVYFEEKTSPRLVIDYLRSQSSHLIRSDNDYLSVSTQMSTFEKVASILLRTINGSSYLTLKEIASICSLLEEFLAYLDPKQTVDIEKLVALRIKLRKYYENILASKLSADDLKMTQYIEHFHQSLFLNHLSLESIVGSIWPPIYVDTSH